MEPDFGERYNPIRSRSINSIENFVFNLILNSIFQIVRRWKRNDKYRYLSGRDRYFTNLGLDRTQSQSDNRLFETVWRFSQNCAALCCFSGQSLNKDALCTNMSKRVQFCSHFVINICWWNKYTTPVG